MRYVKQRLQLIVIGMVLLAALYVVASDLGNYEKASSGAGDIWWAGIPQIQEAYENIAGPKQNKN